MDISVDQLFAKTTIVSLTLLNFISHFSANG